MRKRTFHVEFTHPAAAVTRSRAKNRLKTRKGAGSGFLTVDTTTFRREGSV